MWTETASIRKTLRTFLPERAFLRRDRGDALLVSNALIFNPDLSEIPGFILEREGTLLRIRPDTGWIFRVEEQAIDPPDYFSKTLVRFRGENPDRENLLLFTHGLKLLDAGSSAAEAEITAFERSLRQRAAAALRGGCGGGLYACAILMNQINNLYKGEHVQ